MKNTSNEMLQTADGKTFLTIYLVILVYASKCAARFITTEREKFGSAYLKLEVAEEMILSAKEKLLTDRQSAFPLDCEELHNNGEIRSGIHFVWPNNRIISGPIAVYCDMDTDGGGWTVIQRRGNFGQKPHFFNQNWQSYKEGFGYLEEEFWLGNDYIYGLSNQKPYTIRFDLTDSAGSKRYAKYDMFWIEDERSNYTLHVSGYVGDAGDSFSSHNGSKFTTNDRDNDRSSRNCAVDNKGGWWYTNCLVSNLNGEYFIGKKEPTTLGVIWYHWKSSYESLAATEMKIRRNPSRIK